MRYIPLASEVANTQLTSRSSLPFRRGTEPGGAEHSGPTLKIGTAAVLG